MSRLGSLFFLFLFLCGCGANAAKPLPEADALKKFAYANCMMWFFEGKGYDSEGIRNVAGGIVETSDVSLEEFQEVALLVKDYSPKLEMKHDVDPELLKCFYLEDSDSLSGYFN